MIRNHPQARCHRPFACLQNVGGRSGISIIEVLISIVVATVGVLGVFALIPFAIRQAEIGINEEAAITAARNASSDFENYGYHTPTRWAIPDFRDDNGVGGTTDYLTPFDPTTTGSPPNPTLSPGVYCIDPWGRFQHELADPNMSYMPYSDYPVTSPFPRMRRISLFLDPTAMPPLEIDRSLTRHMFSSPDDVVMTVQKDALDLEYPEQSYFTGGARQFSGRTSWQVFVAASPFSAQDVHFFTVVSHSRDTNALRGPDDTSRLYDRLFRVEMPAAGMPPQYMIGGGDITIRELSTPLNTDSQIRRGSWLMLIGSSDSATDPTIQSIGFYRVIEADRTVDAPGPPVQPRYEVSLQGGDFILSPSATSMGDSTHYAVLLPDVLNVYERTMRFPTQSNWN